MRTRFGTGQRLFIAFALLVSTFALASYLTMAHVRSIHEGLLQTKHYEEGVRLALELSSAVRDQYAHQAHTIILGNDSHLVLYAAARAAGGHDRAGPAYAKPPDERAWVDEIGHRRKLDRVFRERIVPAVLKREAADVQEEHGHAQVQVTLIQERTDRLVDRFESSIGSRSRRTSRPCRWRPSAGPSSSWSARRCWPPVGLYIYRSVARPVARLQAGAARMAGEISTPASRSTRPDEFGALARQFNAMTQSLKDHQERLVQSEKLAGIGRLAAGVAHEINNPLAVILGYANLLQRATGEPADDLRIIEDESLRAQEIVEGLLDLSRPLASRASRWTCGRSATRSSSGSGGQAARGCHRLGHGFGHGRGQPQKLRQVVLNLVKNAAEAAGAGGPGRGRDRQLRRRRELVVRDIGPGLSPRRSSALFEPFFTTKPTGTGLGLAVSLGIVQAHGGTIEAANSPPGGARFTIRLPAAPVEGGVGGRWSRWNAHASWWSTTRRTSSSSSRASSGTATR